MFATFPRTRGQRRGVVLILVLAMLSLLALVGVTFATFSGQARTNARIFSQAQRWPDSSEMMDYALAQLIDDTDNPMSAIRGHSLKRDMYGNDALYNAALSANPSTGGALLLTGVTLIGSNSVPPITITDTDNSTKTINVNGLYQCSTNIVASDPAFYGYNFTRWIMRFPAVVDTSAPTAGKPIPYYPAETHEILAQSVDPTSGILYLYIAPWDASYAGLSGGVMPTPTVPTEAPPSYSQAPTIPYPLPSTYPSTGYSGSLQYYNYYNTSPTSPGQSTLVGLQWRIAGMTQANMAAAFTLDGRFLHAFNGPGMDGVFAGASQYANFRVNGNILSGNLGNPLASTAATYGFPNTICGMDEDYDACDLENWFLAMQSADGQVMIPSFHRPGILIRDGTRNDWTDQTVFSASKILRPRAADGHHQSTFRPLLPDNVTGKVDYDVDNDGDGITDSVWLDLGYPARRNSQGQLYKPLYAFMVIGLNGRIPLNTAGNLQLRDLTTAPYGGPLAAHASGKGYSPSEIDPTYALQNAFGPGYSPLDNAGYAQPGFLSGGTYTPGDNTGPGGSGYSLAQWWGTAGVPIALTQLRNILAGARTQAFLANGAPTNNDANFVLVNGQPVYMPNGVLDAGDNGYANGVVFTATDPIPGRWGEPADQPLQLTGPTTPGTPSAFPGWPPTSPTYGYINPVRAGMSGQWSNATTPPTPLYGDARDDNYNTFDWYPSNTSTSGPYNSSYPTPLLITTLGENADFFDASGSITLPVERIRRFVTPIDVMGDGLVNSYTKPFTPGGHTQLLGADNLGRVAFIKHFRPPGLLVATPPGLALPATLPTSAPGTYTGPIWYPYEAKSKWLSGIGMPAPPVDITVPAPTPLVPVDWTNNLYHGFESYRMPKPQVASMDPRMLGGMPSSPNYTPTNPAWVPTYDQLVNSDIANPFQPSANLNEADEMHVYSPSPFDQPYGPSDLEWLYRQQDVDGVSLNSRLSQLAKVSFLNPKDGQRRRRLFSIETWEPTNFVWANDNPLNDQQWPTVVPGAANAVYGNSRFAPTQSANMNTLGYNNAINANLAAIVPPRLPSIAHRNRKINLNFPLPVSNRYDEPVRQKWIRETYQLLKLILPPKAVDTPEELAQLSQFVVNIIDFRDPDCTATRFVNTDIYYSAKPTPTSPAQLSFAPAGGVGSLGLLAAPWNVATVTPPPSYSPLYDNANSPYVVQYGMENSPVAINEVLAFQFWAKSGGSPNKLGRMWVELVNMLTYPGSDANASDLELDGWDVVIMPDDPTGRPDPYTGQLPYGIPSTSVLGVSTSNKDITDVTKVGQLDPGPLPKTVKAADPNPKYYVIQSDASLLPSGVEKNTPKSTPDATLDFFNKTLMKTATPGQFYWMYLRRPANPFDTTYDKNRPNENRVVVDSFRFMYVPVGPTSVTEVMGTPNMSPGPNDGDVFSLQRLQPYRGGHAVPPIPAVTGATKYCMPSYGYTEQATPATSSDSKSTYNIIYDASIPVTTTKNIYNSIGAKGDDTDYAWDLMPFNDRDFTSVAELLLVPGCPPGLFTKQFVEVAPPITPSNLVTTPFAAATKPTPSPTKFTDSRTKPASATPSNPATTSEPHTFPYLMDEFFYTAQSEPSVYMATATSTPVPGAWPYWPIWPDPSQGPAPIHQPSNFNLNFPITKVALPDPNLPQIPNYIGGPSQAGWYKMFEFFDVPSPAFGSIAQVAQGTNYDWARQDLKPGLLNLNLIIDEEVFFALMSESWLKTLGFIPNWSAPFSPSQQDIDNMGDTRLNVEQLPSAAATPMVVTEVNSNGTPTYGYRLPNQGFMALDPLASFPQTAVGQVFDNRMKAAFSDFLKLRHGGSGFMFAHQLGNVGEPNSATNPVSYRLAAERPFRSLSYPDVNATVMRPAALPPSPYYTTFGPWLPSWTQWTNNIMADGVTAAPYPTYVGDPGVKNPYQFTQNNPVQPPPVPARRLFQIPDVWGNTNLNFPAPPTAGPPVYPANASNWTTTAPSGGLFTGDPFVNWQNLAPNLANLAPNLANPVADLSAIPTDLKLIGATLPPGAPPAPYVFVPNFYLGANTAPTAGGVNDTREHPYYRYDWLHKVLNLTTVRTHQYAVWITAGFFEVIQEGDPSLGMTNPSMAYDRLGQEINIQNGKNIRYRSFFIVDRTRAVGFSPQTQSNFRDCILYRQAIE